MDEAVARQRDAALRQGGSAWSAAINYKLKYSEQMANMSSTHDYSGHKEVVGSPYQQPFILNCPRTNRNSSFGGKTLERIRNRFLDIY